MRGMHRLERLTSQTARQSRRALPSASIATGRKTQVGAPSDTGSGSLRCASPPGTPTQTSRSVRSVSPWRPQSVSVVSARSTPPERNCLAHDLGILADQADAHARLGLGEAAQDRRHEAADDVVGHAEADLALEGRRAHRRHQIVVLRHQPARLGEQALAGRRQHEPPALPLEQAAVERLLQPLDLLAGRGLAHVQRRRRARDAARTRRRSGRCAADRS